MTLSADALLDRRRLKRRLLVWQAAAVLAAVALAAALLGPLVETEGDRVVRLTVSGFIGEDHDREEALDDLADDEAVKALLVSINSPGGSTAGSEALYVALRRVAEKKPVVAAIGTLGASGGYIVALGADRIFARETSITGSIGVLLQSADVTGLLEKLGVQAESVKSSPIKGQPSPLEPFTEEARATIRDVVEDSYRWFRGLVAKRRQLDGERLDAVDTGRVFTGRQAIEAGLVDGLGGEREARAWLDAEKGVSADLPTVDLEYGEQPGLAERLVGQATAKLLSAEPHTLDGLLSLWHAR
jgi:protease-4